MKNDRLHTNSGWIFFSINSCEWVNNEPVVIYLIIFPTQVIVAGIDYYAGCVSANVTKMACYAGYCLNGGTCIVANNDLQCKCPPQYYGESCNYGEWSTVSV
jgi:EGF-like domain